MCDKLDGKTPEDRRMGPLSVLTKAEDTMLASFCIQYLKWGFSINRNDLCDIVQKVVHGLSFRFLEEHIGYEKLQMFESAYGGEWLGDVEDNSLFMLWSNVKDDIGSFHLTHRGPLSVR